MFPTPAMYRAPTGSFHTDGTPVFAAMRPIRIRFDRFPMRTLDGSGLEVVAQYRMGSLFTDSELAIGGQIIVDGVTYVIRQLSGVPTLDGVILMWEAFVE